MPRGSRIEIPGAMHHVTARAPKGLLVFKSRADRLLYLELLAETALACGWSVRCYCLMGTHIHLLVVTPDPNLGAGIKVIHESFVQTMHRWYGTHGPLLPAFKNRLVVTAEHELACLRYIARNPVKDGFCDSPADWEWSAHSALAGLIEAPGFLDVAAVHDVIGIENYTRFAEASDGRLLESLAARTPDVWVAHAVDDYGVPVNDLASHLGCSLRTAYRRLEEARGIKGRLP